MLLFVTGLTKFRNDNLKTFKELLFQISRSILFNSVIVEGKKGFDIEYIIDLTASSRISLHPVWY